MIEFQTVSTCSSSLLIHCWNLSQVIKKNVNFSMRITSLEKEN